MSKTTSGAMDTHLALTVTSLATIWRLTRRDGTEFYFTDHDQDITIDDGDGSATYVTVAGYNRTAIANNSGFSVDNMDLEGMFNSDYISESELRAGLFDYATVRVSMVNWQSLSDGLIKLRKGRLGEVTLTSQGIWQAELRGLMQQLSQGIMSVYQPECRADLGDSNCTVPIKPDVLTRNKAVTLGEFYRVPTDVAASVTINNILTNGSFEDGATGTNVTDIPGWTILTGGWNIQTTIDGLGPQDGAQYLRGGFGAPGASCSMQQTVSLEETGAVLANIDAGNVTMSFTSYRANTDPTDEGQIVVAALDADGAVLSTLYDTTSEDITPDDTWTARNSGAQTLPALTRSLRVTLSATRLVGFLDNESCFDTLSLTLNDTTANDSYWNIYENRYYEVTTAGTTTGTQPAYDTVIGNPTTDGTAVLTARDAWTRDGYISGVTDRRSFEITVDDDRDVNDWFNNGAIVIENGLNATLAREIKDWTQTTNGGDLTIFVPFPLDLAAGVKVRLYPGCDKRIATCRDLFSNAINFQAEPYVPGVDGQLASEDPA